MGTVMLNSPELCDDVYLVARDAFPLVDFSRGRHCCVKFPTEWIAFDDGPGGRSRVRLSDFGLQFQGGTPGSKMYSMMTLPWHDVVRAHRRFVGTS